MFLPNGQNTSPTLTLLGAGTPGYAVAGNPALGIAGTVINQDMINIPIVELCNLVTLTGGTLSEANTVQVYYAIKSMIPSVPAASTATPLVDGTATAGTSTNYAREGHVHPTDTSRAPYADFSLVVASIDSYYYQSPTNYGHGSLQHMMQVGAFLLPTTITTGYNTWNITLGYTFPTEIATAVICFSGNTPPPGGTISCEPLNASTVQVTIDNVPAGYQYGVRIFATGY